MYNAELLLRHNTCKFTKKSDAFVLLLLYKSIALVLLIGLAQQKEASIIGQYIAVLF